MDALTDFLAKLFVKLPTGEVITMEVSHLSTMESIIREISHKDLRRIPPEQQQICFNGHVLDNSLTLNDYDIQNESTLHLYLRPGFGGKYINICINLNLSGR